MPIQIESLFVYPLKSAAGISLSSMEIVATGPRYDREWMLVDKNNRFLSQRTHPQMSQINTELTDTHLVCTADGFDSLAIPLERESSSSVEVSIFGKPTEAEKQLDSQSQWFSDFLGQEVSLVRSLAKPSRQTSGNHGPIKELLFPDSYPFLLTNKNTLTVLNQKLSHSISMKRFRPNIVITGAEADREDNWQSFTINSINFLAAKACARCVIIDVDPENGKKGKEVTRTLSSYRKKDGAILFGQNLSHSGTGEIKVGMRLEDVQEKAV